VGLAGEDDLDAPGFFVFDHRPPLALRDHDDEPNDPAGLTGICWTSDQQKTPRNLKEIAKANGLAKDHQDFLDRQRDKVPGLRSPCASSGENSKQDLRPQPRLGGD
jgi:hypothetical protein